MPDLAEGAVFAGHRIEGVAGRGGMGTVYRATHLALDHVVALKVISPDLAGDESFRARFKSESRIAVSLRHPNVVPIHHAGEEDGLLFVTMDLVEGPDLRKLLVSRGPLKPDQAVAILEQVASALDVAHSRGLVHRDIKPGNILIDSDSGTDHAFLTDFGLTKRMDQASEATGLTSTGAFVGTLDYVAPEQIRGDDLDARTDVYALGCVLYEMLTASAPFADREEKVAKMYAHLQDEPEALEGPAAALEPAIARAMQKEREDRFPSAGDLSRATAAALGGTRPLESERSVATGPAAPTEIHETPPEATAKPTEASEPPATATSERTSEVPPPAGDAKPTAVVPPPVGPADETTEAPAPEAGGPITRDAAAPGDGKGSRSRTPLLAGLLVLVAAVAVGIVVFGGGGDDDGPGQTTATNGGGGGGGPVGSAGDPVPLDGFPVGIAAGGNQVRAVSRNAPTLAEIESGGAIPLTLPEPITGAEALTFAKGAWWATAFEEDLLVGVSSKEGSTVGPVQVGDEPRGIAADGSDLWVTNAAANSISKVVITEGGAEAELPIPLQDAAQPHGIAVDRDNESLWVSSRENDRLIRVGLADPDGDQEFVEVGDNPKGVAIAAGDVWVANADSADVTRYDPDTGEAKAIEVGGKPRDLVAAEGRVWVTNERGFVSAIEAESAEVAGRVDLDGAAAEDIAFDSRSGTLWVTTGGDNTVIPVEPS